MNPLHRLAIWFTIAMALSTFAHADSKAPDACALLTKADAASAIGEIKGEAKSKDGLRGKKCTYDNIKGAWVAVEVFSADAHWDLLKNMALDVQALAGLGDEAFTAKRGVDTRQVYLKKGALMVVVDSSAGLDAAQKLAAAAVKRLP